MSPKTRKEHYKHHASNIVEGRERRRCKQSAIRKEKRDEVLSGKRMRTCDSDQDADDVTIEQVIAACKDLQGKSTDKLSLLKLVRQAFAQGTALVDAFFTVDNSLQCLVGLLSGKDPELQLEAAWCITNMSAGTDTHAMAVAKQAGAYLVTYLSSGNTPLQDQCAWAIGNVAGGGDKCRETLKAQGAVQPLIKLLQNPSHTVVKSAAFALSNFVKDKDTQVELISSGVLQIIPPLLVYSSDPEQLSVAAEIGWLLTYLSASGDHTESLAAAGLVDKVAECVCIIAAEDKSDLQVLTPLLRCLGNLACCLETCDAVRRVCEDERVISTLISCLQNEHHHICKEAAWVMSNITASRKACDIICKLKGHEVIIKLLSTTYDVRHEAMYSLCNMASQAEEFCTLLFSNGAVEHIVPWLHLNSPDTTHLGLCLIQMMLSTNPEAKERFESSRGLDKLETLEYCNNETLAKQTNDILEHFFYAENKET